MYSISTHDKVSATKLGPARSTQFYLCWHSVIHSFFKKKKKKKE